MTKFLWRLGPSVRKAPCRRSPTSWAIRGSPRALRRWRGYWLVNLLTGRRHLFFTMRKKNMCRCGCKGRCSQNAIWTYTRSSWSKGTGLSSRRRSGSRLGPTTRTLVFSAMQVVGQTARGARQKASPCSPHRGTQRLSRCTTPHAERAKATCLSKQVFLGHVHTSRRRERRGQIRTTDIPALGIAKSQRLESSPTCWSSQQIGRVRSKLSSRWCSHHVVESLR